MYIYTDVCAEPGLFEHLSVSMQAKGVVPAARDCTDVVTTGVGWRHYDRMALTHVLVNVNDSGCQVRVIWSMAGIASPTTVLLNIHHCPEPKYKQTRSLRKGLAAITAAEGLRMQYIHPSIHPSIQTYVNTKPYLLLPLALQTLNPKLP